MLEMLLLAAVQVQTIKLPPISPPPPTGVVAVQLAPDLVVKEIRIQNDSMMHVLVANIGTGGTARSFPVRGSVEIAGQSENLGTAYADPLAAGAQAWITLRTSGWVRLTNASSAMAGADLYPEPKEKSGGMVWWPTINPTMPGASDPCPAVPGCVAESDETNNNYAVAGVPRGTPDRLNAPEVAPVIANERG